LATVGVAARRYATALLDIAEEKGAVDRCLKDLRTFRGEMERIDELNGVLINPAVPSDSAEKVVRDVATALGLDGLSVAFLALLGSHRRMSELPEVIIAYYEEKERRAGRESGEVVSAGELSPGQLIKVRDAISKALGRTLVLTKKTEPGLLGGLRVKVGDRVFDLSTRSYLESLRIRLLENR